MSNVSHRRIVKNTIFLYVRMLLLLIVSLFTSRIVLEKLGVTDYGIFNVVGGVALLCAMFNSSLSNATERFLNMALGKNDVTEANRVFNQNLIAFLLIAIIVVIIAETFVKWLVFDKLVIPIEKKYVASVVYQCAIYTVFISLIGIVFLAEIIAHEDMKIFSVVGIFDGFVKLAIAYLINVFPAENLISYAVMMAVASTLTQALYASHCLRNYEECRFRFIWNISLIKETFKFIGWNSVGSVIYMTKDSGVNILMNLFFGPVANAARAVAISLSNAVIQFTNNIFVAIRPQMIKAYVSNEREELLRLFFYSSKFSVLLFWFICLPIMLCVDQVLRLWLVDIPDGAAIFVVWVLADLLLAVLTNPTWSVSLASGNIGRMTLCGNSVLLLVLPICLILFKLGAPAVTAFIVTFLVRILQIIAVVIIANKDLKFTVKRYLYKVIFPFTSVILISSGLMYMLKIYIDELHLSDFLYILLITTASVGVTGGTIYLFGLKKRERSILVNKIKGWLYISN